MRSTVEVTPLPGGNDSGPRIVMLPGLGNRGAGFLPLARALAAFARPVLVEYPEGAHAAVGAAVLARQVSDAVGSIDGAIASSFGGMVAGHLAADGLVRGAAFIGSFTTTAHLGPRGSLFRLMGPLAMIPAPPMLLASIAAMGFIPRALAPDVVPTTRGERSGVWHRAFAVPRSALGVELRDSAVSCVALHGSRDLIVPVSTLERLKASLPSGSRTQIIRGAGHVPYLTHVSQCVEFLQPWLEELSQPAVGELLSGT